MDLPSSSSFLAASDSGLSDTLLVLTSYIHNAQDITVHMYCVSRWRLCTYPCHHPAIYQWQRTSIVRNFFLDYAVVYRDRIIIYTRLYRQTDAQTDTHIGYTEIGSLYTVVQTDRYTNRQTDTHMHIGYMYNRYHS